MMLLSNIDYIPGSVVKDHLGLVSGSTVRAKHFGRDLIAGFKNVIGGELSGYTELLKDSRKEATDRMVDSAIEMGANAIINVRYATSSITQGAAELYVYGTAVVVD